MDQNSSNNDKPSDKSRNLESIYPTPKTVDEIKTIEKNRELEYEKKKPKHVFIVSSFQLYSVLIGFLLVILFIPSLIRFNIISGVFFSFLVATLLAGYAAWMANSVSSSFYKFGIDARPFLILYIAIYATLIGLMSWLIADSNLTLLFWLGTLTHFALVYILMKIIFNSGKR